MLVRQRRTRRSSCYHIDFDENHSGLTGRALIAGAPTRGGAGMLAFGSRAFISPDKASASSEGTVSAGARF